MTEEHQAASLRAANAGVPDHSGYPGQDLGLPQAGPGAIGGMARRVGALFIDWFLCSFVVVALIRPKSQLDVELLTLVVFGLQDWMLTALTGFTIGKRLLRLRVARLDGQMVGLGWGLVRTVLLLTVVPPLLLNRDLRGLHDRASNTAVLRI